MLKNAMKAIHQRRHLHHFEMAGSILILMLIIVCDLGVGRSDPRSVELLFSLAPSACCRTYLVFFF
jgi:hypothetical protein